MAPRRAAIALLLACGCVASALASYELDIGRKMLQDNSPAVHPRMDMLDISAMDEKEPYRVMMLLAWQQLTTSSDTDGPFTYFQLAGVHGQKWAYNGVDAPNNAFCRHRDPDFAPWHRAYMTQFERALIEAAKEAAGNFKDSKLRRQYGRIAETIRLPYWDWTNPKVPSLMTEAMVTVLDYDSGESKNIRNPFDAYKYTAAAGDGYGAGRRIRRGPNWSSTLSRSAPRFGNEMASFLRSNNWRCTYVSGVGCTGNLEGTHDEIHNVLGGTKGELSTVPYAGFDPLFWLHHCMVDRVLWLFQNNGGQWMGSSSHSPFQNLEGDAADISSYGYSYSPSRSSNGRRRKHNSGEARLSEDEDPAVAKIGSLAGRAAVRAAVQEWTGNYTGYTWSVRFMDLNQHQMDEAVHLLVYLKSGNASTQAIPSEIEDLNDLRMRPNYCGSVAGFNENVHVHFEVGDTTISRAVDLTQCLREAGKDPNVAAANPEDFSRGPATVPVHLSDLQIVAVTAKGEDVSDKYNVGKTVISWSVPIMRSAAEVRAANGVDPIEAQALAHPLAFNADQEVLSMVVGDAAAV